MHVFRWKYTWYELLNLHMYLCLVPGQIWQSGYGTYCIIFIQGWCNLVCKIKSADSSRYTPTNSKFLATRPRSHVSSQITSLNFKWSQSVSVSQIPTFKVLIWDKRWVKQFMYCTDFNLHPGQSDRHTTTNMIAVWTKLQIGLFMN